ncbi:MAG: hypothetical protein KDE09_12505, partial [Anaerolineales bacterium]|nr:hypothetical protein [Anaerolineales bacterium]
ECPDGGLLLTVNALVQGVLFELTEDPPGSGIYTGHISLDGHTGGLMELVWTCSNGSFSEPLGRIKLWDPSGYVTDAVTGEPIPGATVTLYQVLDWRPRNHTEDVGPNSCESNSSKPAGQPWSQAAPTDGLVIADPHSGLISPTLNAMTTDLEGYYGWDVATGCWFVVVEAPGYATLTSPVVGVPPEVVDLNLSLVPQVPTAVAFSSIAVHRPAASALLGLLVVAAFSLLGLTAAQCRRPRH